MERVYELIKEAREQVLLELYSKGYIKGEYERLNSILDLLERVLKLIKP